MRRLLVTPLLLLVASTAAANCVPFPCIDDCAIQSRGQLNWVVFDRAAGTIDMIPNIRVFGSSATFALVVPTPSEPTLSSTSLQMWNQAILLTAPAQPAWSSFDGCNSCEETYLVADAGLDPTQTDGTVVVSQQIVGAFEATILSSDDPGSLQSWLSTHGYAITAAQVELLTPYIERDWYFTAMRLDPARATMPPAGWDANVDPVVFRFVADEFELPLPLFTINQGATLPLAVYVVDDHRVTLPGFQTRYANRIDDDEYSAISSAYPELSVHLAAGRFLTRLDRTFAGASGLQQAIVVATAPDDEEFRRLAAMLPEGAVWAMLLLVAVRVGRRLDRRSTQRG